MGIEQTRRFGVVALDRFLAQCQVRRVPAKTTVVSGGEASTSLYFIMEGSVAVISEDEDGQEIVVAYLNRGEFFGEMGLFQETATRSARVRTRGECVLGEISYARFRELARSDPDLLFELASQLAARLKVTTRKVRDLVFLDVAGRIARTLLDLCEQPDALTHPDGMQIRISRQEIGRIVGCSREMAGRVLKLLEEQALITAAGKTIVVLGARPGSNRVVPLTSRLHRHKQN
ncbi:MAG: cAMP-activated global transcriptional regulator CRP [Gammaproteobacteria bacterium]